MLILKHTRQTNYFSYYIKISVVVQNRFLYLFNYTFIVPKAHKGLCAFRVYGRGETLFFEFFFIGLVEGEAIGEGGAFADFTFYGDGALVAIHNPFGDGET